MSERCIACIQVSSSIVVDGDVKESRKKFIEVLKSKLGPDFRIDEKSFLLSSGIKLSN